MTAPNRTEIMAWLDAALREIKDRVSVVEERTQNHESRLEDLEKWRDEVDDRLDKE